MKLPRNRRYEDKRVIPTKDEIRILIEKVPDRSRPLIVTAIFTGLRISELRGLTWDCIDFDLGLIHVRWRRGCFNGMSKSKSRSGKRSVPMAPMVRNILKVWRASCPKGDLDIVFPKGKGNIENHANIHNRVFVPLLVGNGRAKFSFHVLRHAAASLFIEQNCPPKNIQTLLGHASINMKMDVYGHLFENLKEDVGLFAKL